MACDLTFITADLCSNYPGKRIFTHPRLTEETMKTRTGQAAAQIVENQCFSRGIYSVAGWKTSSTGTMNRLA